MNSHVFANGNEIASRSADGCALACQPDVCVSPGALPTGVAVPYANSVFARDLTAVSCTVRLMGGGAALEDSSYFATSYGNESATLALQRGVVSGVIRGKAHFRSWSMNVKLEGLGVARHMDSVSHNHANPANALLQKYRSRSSRQAARSAQAGDAPSDNVK